MLPTTLRILAAGAVLACALPAHAAPVTIDFEGYPGATIIDNQYAAHGVTFAGGSISNWVGWGTPTGSLASALDGGDEPDTRTGFIKMNFAMPVTGVSLGYANYGIEVGGTLKAFDGNNNLLESLTYGAAAYEGMELISFSASGISSIVVTSAGPTYLMAIDNLTFDVRDVPEPAALALLLLGALAMRASGPRKKA